LIQSLFNWPPHDRRLPRNRSIEPTVGENVRRKRYRGRHHALAALAEQNGSCSVAWLLVRLSPVGPSLDPAIHENTVISNLSD
jgi:hypothetical protein